MKHQFYKLIFFFLFSTSTIIGQTDSTLVIKHLVELAGSNQYRNYQNIDQLNKIAQYIHDDFKKYSDSVSYQSYTIKNVEYKNVICSFGTENKKRIIIGAHYDVCGNQPGADDNASGVSAILELARMLKNEKLNYRIDLVAYTLEEPPYFRTQFMGSHVHAKYLHDNNIDVYGMISVEMIGYFSDEKKSQKYPIGILSWIYGNKGDYITMVNKFGAGKFARRFSNTFKKSKLVKTKKFKAPKKLPGIDFSDHLNYWKYGYSALMITDTAFYRNTNYHKPTDKIYTLDIKRMCLVINGIFTSIIKM